MFLAHALTVEAVVPLLVGIRQVILRYLSLE